MKSGDGVLSVFVAARSELLSPLISAVESCSKISLVGTAVSGEEAVTALAELSAHVALVDFSLPGISGVKVVEFFVRRRPDMVSILLADEADPRFLRLGMLAGAREFIVWPVTAAELELSLQRAARLSAQREGESRLSPPLPTAHGPAASAKVVAMVGAKGGTGASFLTANLASIAGQNMPGVSVALVDLNLNSGDLAAVTDIQPQKDLTDLVPVIGALDQPLIKSIATVLRENLDLYAAPARLSMQEVFSREQVNLLIDGFRRSYDLVFIDAGSSLNQTTVSACEACDLVLISLVPEVVSVKAGKRLIDSLEALGIGKGAFAAAVNRCTAQGLSVQRVADHIGIEVLGAIPESRQVRLMLDEGRLMDVSDRTQVREAIDGLAVSLQRKLGLLEGLSVN
jgi:pilus assembly protein CpaE